MKVKLLKDLPGCKAGTYGRQSDNSFFWEFARPNGYTEKLFYEFSISRIEANPDFFEILPEPKFKVGDWAWVGCFLFFIWGSILDKMNLKLYMASIIHGFVFNNRFKYFKSYLRNNRIA